MLLFPIINTKRLILRKLQIEDTPVLVELLNNRKITDNILNIPYPFQEPDAVFRIRYVHKGFVTKERYVFAIIANTTGILVGEIALHLQNKEYSAQLAYWVGEPHWNKGYATEAINAIIDFAFETLNLKNIYATCKSDNIASIKVLAKNALNLYKTNETIGVYVRVR